MFVIFLQALIAVFLIMHKQVVIVYVIAILRQYD